LQRFFESDELKEIGGRAYLYDLAASAVTVINAGEYGRLVYDLYLKRELIALGEDVVNRAYGGDVEETATDQIEKAEQNLYDLAVTDVDTDRPGLEPVSRFIDATLAEIKAAAQGDGPVGLPTGLHDLDRMTGGLMPSDLVVVAARPGMGKTALAGTFAKAAAVRGKRVGFFSLEMSERQMLMRLLAMESGIAASEMRTGEVTNAQMSAIESAAQSVAALPIMLDGQTGIPVSAIRHRARRMKRQGSLDLVIVDYLQLIDPGNRYQGQRVNEVAQISGAMKGLAKELNVPVVLLSQLSREVERRDDKRPHLSDLRDSGSIEQDADVVLLLYRESYYLEMDGPPKARTGESDDHYADRMAKWERERRDAEGTAKIIVAKQRNGRTGVVDVHFNAQRTI
ncbi:MAG: replicative DNA helicase, partial [Rhodospirillales bacterium]